MEERKRRQEEEEVQSQESFKYKKYFGANHVKTNLVLENLILGKPCDTLNIIGDETAPCSSPQGTTHQTLQTHGGEFVLSSAHLVHASLKRYYD